MKALSLLIILSELLFQNIEKDYLIIVNAQNPMPNGYEETIKAELEPIIHTQNDSRETQYMIKEAAFAFDSMLYAAKDAGYDLYATSAYRSYKYQQKIYDLRLNQCISFGMDLDEAIKETEKRISRPGYSEHHTGLAVDIYNEKSGKAVSYESDEFKWLYENAPRYGFVLRYPKGKESITGHRFDPCHFRFVGKCAKEMAEKCLVIEEYVEIK